MAEKNNIVDGVHMATDEELYVYPENPTVREHLEWFRGLKLGFMMHWMPSCQFASYESWPLSEDAVSWSREDIDWTDDMDEAMQQYIDCNKTFNPFKFRPDQWAKLAKECGFQYLLFTTKHHDGFCMYDSKYSDYKITAPDCPFHKNKHADVVRALFDAFREEGLAISAYYSKPDWHSPYYWSPDFPKAMTRNTNYDPLEHPEVWEKFVEFTHNQMTELCSDYGKIDVLWLDGGQVQPDINHQDIRLGELVEKIRSTTQPHLLVCDRTVGGPYENIITPEGGVPEKPMNVPWEACIPVGSSFAFHYNDVTKTPKQLVHMILDIVSKGGSLALNLTPRPDGKLPDDQVDAIRHMGRWLKVNGEGIYFSHIAPTASNARMKFTEKDGNIYLYYLYGTNTHTGTYLPPRLTINIEGKIKSVTLLRTGEEIPFVQGIPVTSDGGGNTLLNTSKVSLLDADYADCFRIEMA